MRASVRFRLAGAASVAAVVALAGCASQGTSGGAPPVAAHPAAAIQAVQLAVGRTAHVSSMTFTMTASVAGTGLVESGTLTTTKPLRGVLTMNIPQLGQSEIRLVGDSFYMHSPALAAHLGKPWVKMDLAMTGKLSGLNLKQLFDQASQAGPAGTLALLSKAGTITRAGSDTIRGAVATHYTGTINLTKALHELSPALASQLGPLVSQLGVKDISIDLWIGADALPVRAVESYDSSVGHSRVQIDFTAYNVPVRVAVPPASQTVDLASVLTKLAAG